MRSIQIHPCPSVPHLFIAYHQPPPFWTLYGHCHARPSGPPVAAPGSRPVEAETMLASVEGCRGVSRCVEGVEVSSGCRVLSRGV